MLNIINNYIPFTKTPRDFCTPPSYPSYPLPLPPKTPTPCSGVGVLGGKDKGTVNIPQGYPCHSLATGTSDFLCQHTCWIQPCQGRSSSCTGKLEQLDLLAPASPATCYFPDGLQFYKLRLPSYLRRGRLQTADRRPQRG